jgi:hypothetical protein
LSARWLLPWVCCLVGGCASIATDPYARAPIAEHLVRADDVGECARLFRRVDELIDLLGVRDAQAPRVPGFPYLRADRFAAALGDRALQQRAFGPWSELMAGLDRQARSFELGNAADPALPSAAALDACRYQLAVSDHDRLRELAQAAQVPDEYSTVQRALGLYPLTRVLFAAGIRRWQQAVRELFATPLESVPVHGELVRYVPADTDVALPRVPRSTAFGLPVLAESRWRELVQQHAPALRVDTAGAADRVGALAWRQGQSAPAVDAAAPTGYARVAFTLIDGRVHAQLVYTYWFPERPREHALDVLAGALDGLIWRVTLDRDFQPLVYDTIHPCGCYHLFFPTARARARAGRPPGEGRFDEGLFAPQSVRAPRADQRIELRVASRTHYVQRVTVVDRALGAGTRYALRDADELRGLPLPAEAPADGVGLRSRSVYGTDGLIAGSERLERFLFWPMGIASAGQMRQWGRHATAFVGRRHFDAPHLFDRYFAVEDRPAEIDLGERAARSSAMLVPRPSIPEPAAP